MPLPRLPSDWALAANNNNNNSNMFPFRLKRLTLHSNNLTGSVPGALRASATAGAVHCGGVRPSPFLLPHACAVCVDTWGNFAPWGPGAMGCLTLANNTGLCGQLPNQMPCIDVTGTLLGMRRGQLLAEGR
jgi:hypothetical protein